MIRQELVHLHKRLQYARERYDVSVSIQTHLLGALLHEREELAKALLEVVELFRGDPDGEPREVTVANEVLSKTTGVAP